jgi:hypothetical protein
MARFVLDPAALLELAESGAALAPTHRLVAPNSVRSGALDLLLARVQAGTLTESAALALHERMTETRIRLLGDRVSRRNAWRLALEHGWPSVRLAEYISVTRLQADALVALDPELRELADGLVPLATLDELAS